jgi:hypothetical protein
MQITADDYYNVEEFIKISVIFCQYFLTRI